MKRQLEEALRVCFFLSGKNILTVFFCKKKQVVTATPEEKKNKPAVILEEEEEDEDDEDDEFPLRRRQLPPVKIHKPRSRSKKTDAPLQEKKPLSLVDLPPTEEELAEMAAEQSRKRKRRSTSGDAPSKRRKAAPGDAPKTHMSDQNKDNVGRARVLHRFKQNFHKVQHRQRDKKAWIIMQNQPVFDWTLCTTAMPTTAGSWLRTVRSALESLTKDIQSASEQFDILLSHGRDAISDVDYRNLTVIINVAQIVSQLFDPRVSLWVEDARNPAFQEVQDVNTSRKKLTTKALVDPYSEDISEAMRRRNPAQLMESTQEVDSYEQQEQEQEEQQPPEEEQSSSQPLVSSGDTSTVDSVDSSSPNFQIAVDMQLLL